MCDPPPLLIIYTRGTFPSGFAHKMTKISRRKRIGRTIKMSRAKRKDLAEKKRKRKENDRRLNKFQKKYASNVNEADAGSDHEINQVDDVSSSSCCGAQVAMVPADEVYDPELVDHSTADTCSFDDGNWQEDSDIPESSLFSL